MEHQALRLIFEADQREARFEERMRPILFAFVAIFVILGLYAALSAYGIVPAAPWSAIGKARS